MNTSESIEHILPALFAAKSEIKKLYKNADNPFYKSKYCDLNTHLEEIEPCLSAHDLILLQPVNRDYQHDYVESIVYHKSGEWISSSMTLQTVQDMQKAGSAVTYARRYTLGALFSVRADDDDANEACGLKKQEPAKPQAPKKPAAKAEAEGWRNVRIHFGKNGPHGDSPGMTLGELKPGQLNWYQCEWPTAGKQLSGEDIALRAALDTSIKEEACNVKQYLHKQIGIKCKAEDVPQSEVMKVIESQYDGNAPMTAYDLYSNYRYIQDIILSVKQPVMWEKGDENDEIPGLEESGREGGAKKKS